MPSTKTRRLRGERGSISTEYAMVAIAAAAFAAILLKVLTSGAVTGALTDIIERALS
ncbi:DUF4244 domain-containing protein [Phytomonospora endophytica]|uniref:DUF4244 domain-containing protein n=1 Tax=Phytomonospora endophytica TaxID=714109 RepID=A0A841FTX4_9ACTN|nr:DUF4244 domain-containing protein [Phytomonospora endophytica]MBB6035430.1 hypothetical protein [Phytomonospora endophytica]GIG63818.1 hypothetical protein Pen01_01130 [Phytomonospora endophytica]